MDNLAWSAIEADLLSRDVAIAVSACDRLKAAASLEDRDRLLELLKHHDFFVREAAAWPLAELMGPRVIEELLVAYQRGFDEGHDNDGFSTALIEIPDFHPETQAVLAELISHSDGKIRENALWLLEFCKAS